MNVGEKTEHEVIGESNPSVHGKPHIYRNHQADDPHQYACQECDYHNVE